MSSFSSQPGIVTGGGNRKSPGSQFTTNNASFKARQSYASQLRDNPTEFPSWNSSTRLNQPDDYWSDNQHRDHPANHLENSTQSMPHVGGYLPSRSHHHGGTSGGVGSPHGEQHEPVTAFADRTTHHGSFSVTKPIAHRSKKAKIMAQQEEAAYNSYKASIKMTNCNEVNILGGSGLNLSAVRQKQARSHHQKQFDRKIDHQNRMEEKRVAQRMEFGQKKAMAREAANKLQANTLKTDTEELRRRRLQYFTS